MWRVAKRGLGRRERAIELLAALQSSAGRAAKRTLVSIVGPVAVRRVERQGRADPATWGLDRSDDGVLRVGGRSLRSIAEQHGSPLHVVDADRLRAHVSSAASVGVGLAAAHRCTHVAGVVDLVRRAGCKISTASRYELDAALAAGVDADGVLHAPAVLSTDELDHARRIGVGIVCAPSLRSFGNLGHAPTSDGALPGRIGVTVVIGETNELSAHIAGADAATLDQIDHLHVRASNRRLTTTDLDALVDGVAAAWVSAVASLPLTSLSVEVDIVPPTVSLVSSIDARLNQSIGLPVPGPDGLDEEFSATLLRFHDRLRTAGVDASEIIIDPGSIITGGMQFTLATVLEVDATRRITHVVLDCGINVADNTLVERHELLATGTDRSTDTETPLRPHRLVGPICTPADVLYANWWMPATVAGDVLAIMDTGGPYVAESTTFSFPRPAVVSVSAANGVQVLRNAETFEDLVALDSFGSDVTPD